MSQRHRCVAALYLLDLLVVGETVNGRPFANEADVAGFGVGEIGVEDETGIDAEVERSLILKVDGDGVVFAGGEQLDFFDCPALRWLWFGLLLRLLLLFLFLI